MYLGIWQWQNEDRRPTWDEVFMMHAQLAATRSTCDRGPRQKFRPHRGTGAVIVSPDNRKISIGYNGSPPGTPHCDDNYEYILGSCGHRLGTREHVVGRGSVGHCSVCSREVEATLVKGGHIISNDHCVRTIHAEENAILNSTFDLRGCRMYSTTIPCYDCCKRILAVGIVEVIYQNIYESRYFDFSEGVKLLEDHGVLVRQLDI